MMDKAHYLYELCDAKHDMLKGLNKLTDLENPSFQDVKAMGILAHAVKDLAEASMWAMEHADADAEAEAMSGHTAKVK